MLIADASIIPLAVLNEVLSLNAQEWWTAAASACRSEILNEVLSLNAQESQTATSVYTLDFPQ